MTLLTPDIIRNEIDRVGRELAGVNGDSLTDRIEVIERVEDGNKALVFRLRRNGTGLKSEETAAVEKAISTTAVTFKRAKKRVIKFD